MPARLQADPVGDIRVSSAVKTVHSLHLKRAGFVFSDNKQCASWWVRSWDHFYQRMQTLPSEFWDPILRM